MDEAADALQRGISVVAPQNVGGVKPGGAERGEAVLIDYKSDQISGSASEKESVLKERYAVQLAYYAQAIEASSGLKVREKIIWLIRDSLSFLL